MRRLFLELVRPWATPDTPGAFYRGLLLALFAAIWGLIRARLVAPKRITDDHIWLKGVHPAFLDELPPLPRTW